MRFARLFLPLSLSLCASGCLTLQDLSEGVCGNGVLDDDEDCEPVEGTVEFTCRPPDGTELECTYECNTKGKCPPGFGCGTDDVCRRGGGTFESLAFVQAGSQADMLLAGDFDADRRQDVVAVEPGRARIYSTDASGNVDQTTVTSTSPPAIGKLGLLDGPTGAVEDTTDDLVLPLGFGIGALLAQGDGSFKSKAYGSITLDSLEYDAPELPGAQPVTILDVVPMAFDLIPSDRLPYSGDETVGVASFQLDLDGQTVERSALVDYGTTGAGTILALGPSLREALAVTRPVRGNFDDDPCGELVLPRPDATGLRVYKVCRPNLDPSVGYDYEWAAGNEDGSAKVGEIEAAGLLAGPAFVRDVDGDGRDDIVATVKDAKGLALQVAYGVGDNHFRSSSTASVVDDQLGPLTSSLTARPLAFERIDPDGVPDLVDTSGIMRGSQGIAADGAVQLAFSSWRPSPRPWTDAAVADINGDGRSDVLASSDGATDIDVLVAALDGLWNATQISTAGTVSTLVAGDFDGDLVQDLVFDSILSPEQSRILISYGRTSGGPEEPSEVAGFGSIQHLMSGDIHAFGTDSIQELGVISATNLSRAFSFFPGTPTRLLQAPLLLNNPVDQHTNEPLAAELGALGYHFPEPGFAYHTDLAVVTVEGKRSPGEIDATQGPSDELSTAKLNIWGLYGGSSDADFLAVKASVCTAPGGLYFRRLESAYSIAVAPSLTDGSPGAVFAGVPTLAPGAGPDGEQFQISSVLGQVVWGELNGLCWHEADPANVFRGALGELFFRVRMFDLNANGTPEVLAIKKTYSPVALSEYLQSSVDTGGVPSAGSPGSLTPETSQLVLLWDGDAAKPYVFEDETDDVTDVHDFTAGDIDGDGEVDLLVLDGARIRRFEVPDGTQQVVTGDDITSAAPYSGEGRAILLADVDGDGILDLAVRSDSLQIYKGKAAKDRDDNHGGTIGAE